MSLASSTTQQLPADTFPFGKNWQRYVAESLNPQRERMARESLEDLVGLDLTGKSFLDIGCGSGLFSLSAHRLGATPIVSVDVDPDSVTCCEHLRGLAGSPTDWSVLHGSIVDSCFVASLDPADIVYSWGVLHHTGDLWRALAAAVSLVRPGGVLCIAIYNAKTSGMLTSARWEIIKRLYNRSARPIQACMRVVHRIYWNVYRARRAARLLRSGSGLRGLSRAQAPPRGMARSSDLVDWLGGYPYEYATADEIVRFCEDARGLAAVRVDRVEPEQIGNNEFVFIRQAHAPGVSS